MSAPTYEATGPDREAVRDLARQLNQAHDEHSRYVEQHSAAERDYRKARSNAWLDASGTAREREDAVDAATADLRYKRDVAAGMEKHALELIRSRRQVLSAYQSLLNAERESVAFDRTGPEGGP